MKKINSILCVCVIAATAFLASCKNTAEYNFVTSTSTYNRYSVTGTYTEVVANKTVDSNGTAGTSDVTDTTVRTITSGDAEISWTESKVLEGNISNQYTIDFKNLYGKSQSKQDVGSTAGTFSPAEPTINYFGSGADFKLYFNKIDDAFFMKNDDGDWSKITVTGDLESGEDFDIEVSTKKTVDNFGNSYRAEDAKAQNITTTTKTYKLSFKNAK